MARHRHEFIKQYDGMIAFGLSRQEDERSLIAFVQKYSDDDLMRLLSKRISDEEIVELVDFLMKMLKKHLTEEEYHRYFLKD
jgi:hypothetical protein